MSDSPNASLPPAGKTLRELRARAHSLKPVVWIAADGTTPAVLREIDRSLRTHELIKIHAAVDGRAAREEASAQICASLSAHPVQIIGKMLIVFRPNPPEPEAGSERPRHRSERHASPPARAAQGLSPWPQPRETPRRSGTVKGKRPQREAGGSPVGAPGSPRNRLRRT